ncbi:hypothetical protein BC826DRAFT_972399 [Russula brevipes]|nr:hypothetical protein BC826DRAFT_972399 [Russula brevipes]
MEISDMEISDIFGIPKLVSSYRQQSVTLTTLNWVAGTPIAVILYCVAMVKEKRPEIWPLFFRVDYAPPILEFLLRSEVYLCILSCVPLRPAVTLLRFALDVRRSAQLEDHGCGLPAVKIGLVVAIGGVILHQQVDNQLAHLACLARLALSFVNWRQATPGSQACFLVAHRPCQEAILCFLVAHRRCCHSNPSNEASDDLSWTTKHECRAHTTPPHGVFQRDGSCGVGDTFGEEEDEDEGGWGVGYGARSLHHAGTPRARGKDVCTAAARNKVAIGENPEWEHVDGLPPNEVNDTLELIFNANGNLNCGSRHSKLCTNLADHSPWVRARSIHSNIRMCVYKVGGVELK